MKSLMNAVFCVAVGLSTQLSAAGVHHSTELIFPGEHWHNHGSCLVECPNGDVLVCWFHGSGERKADDVVILGARKVKATGKWTKPFLMADTPEFPDTNCCMIIDPQERLWLMWPTIQANTWESALMKYKISTSYMNPEGAPTWDTNKVMHIKPGNDFPEKVKKASHEYVASLGELPPASAAFAKKWQDKNIKDAAHKLTRRLGWFTRAHPYILDDGTMLVGLYSDGFSFSLVAATNDWGESWRISDPIVGGANIQPSFAQRKNGNIVTYMRDNGPPPKRVMVSESADKGMTWSTVYDHPQLANPGAGLEVANLADGDWICIYNDVEDNRYSLAVSLSSDEGKTWDRTRHLELDPKKEGRYHYPAIIQAKDGSLHATYSIFYPSAEGERKSIKYAKFTKDWILQGD